MTTWEETDEELAQLRKEIYDFYELHTPKDVRESAALQLELRHIQLRCHAVHHQRIALNLEALKRQRSQALS